MQKIRVFSALVLTLSVATSFSFLSEARAQTKPAGIEWVNDYNAARALAKGANRPMFMAFGADRCGWCRELKSAVFADIHVQREAKNWIFSYYDVDGAGDALGQQFRIASLPTLFFCAPNGAIIERIDGFIPSNQVLAKMRRIRANYGGATPRPVGKTVTQGSAKRTAWHQMPEIKGALQNPRARGVFLLDNGAVVPLKAPTKKAPPKKTAKKVAKTKK